MIRALELRFKYHFDSDRPTNRPDKVRLGTLEHYNLIKDDSLNTFSNTSSACSIRMKNFFPFIYSRFYGNGSDGRI